MAIGPGIAHLPGARHVARLDRMRRERGLRGLATHVRIVGMHRAHVLGERLLRRGGRDATTGRHELHELTIREGDAQSGVHYLPTPWLVLDWIHDCLPSDKHRWIFIDLGCGKGRALLSAADRGYKSVVGVEFAVELAKLARCNLARSGLSQPRVAVVEADAATFDFPDDDPLVVFLFNPFGPPVMNRVARRIAEAARHPPRRCLVAYLNPEHHATFATDPAFRSVRLPLRPRIALKLFSPYKLHLYETTGA